MSAGLTIKSGPWSQEQVISHLQSALIPLRLATSGQQFPLVQSLWFVYADAALWCATQRDSIAARRITARSPVGFEIASDAPPYRGVRGHGQATLLVEPAVNILEQLIDRYLAHRDVPLARWLMSRADSEVAIRIDHLVTTSWDFTARMDPATGTPEI